ncbi:MAG: hypothetical protein ABH956_01920 [Candidatus Nealsonbacteria bacterium]
MHYNKGTIKKIKNDCNLCKSNFLVWLSTLNFEKEKEDGIRRHLNNHCPSCRLCEKRKHH